MTKETDVGNRSMKSRSNRLDKRRSVNHPHPICSNIVPCCCRRIRWGIPWNRSRKTRSPLPTPVPNSPSRWVVLKYKIVNAWHPSYGAITSSLDENLDVIRGAAEIYRSPIESRVPYLAFVALSANNLRFALTLSGHDVAGGAGGAQVIAATSCNHANIVS
jgi:hypothetical protein